MFFFLPTSGQAATVLELVGVAILGAGLCVITIGSFLFFIGVAGAVLHLLASAGDWALSKLSK